MLTAGLLMSLDGAGVEAGVWLIPLEETDGGEIMAEGPLELLIGTNTVGEILLEEAGGRFSSIGSGGSSSVGGTTSSSIGMADFSSGAIGFSSSDGGTIGFSSITAVFGVVVSGNVDFFCSGVG